MLKMGLVLFSVVVAVVLGVSYAYAETQLSDKVVVLHTDSGDMVIELFSNDAPNTVKNFLNLTEHNFYDRTVFHRVIKDFMIQGGDPKTKPLGYQSLSEWGTGNAGYTIPCEFNDIRHVRGIVSMARFADPDSASSQFFIVHKDAFALDGNYAVFGRLATNSSYTTLDRIANLENEGEATNYIPYKWGEGEIQKAEVKNRSDIPDLLDQGEPLRLLSLANKTEWQYSDSELGISFMVPANWEKTEINRSNPNSPQLAFAGPKDCAFTPVISFSIKTADGKSLDEYIDAYLQELQPSVDAGKLVILKKEKTTVMGGEAHIINAISEFKTTYFSGNVKFKEITISRDNEFYVLTYLNSEKNFEKMEPQFQSLINSLQTPKSSLPLQQEGDKNSNAGCLIATAAYGTEMANQVQQLREIRDNILLNTSSGTSFMNAFNHLYYSFSPTVSDWERQSPAFRELVRMSITPMLSTLSILNYVDIDSEHELLGYGVGIILLNSLFYLVAPVALIVTAKRYLK